MSSSIWPSLRFPATGEYLLIRWWHFRVLGFFFFYVIFVIKGVLVGSSQSWGSFGVFQGVLRVFRGVPGLFLVLRTAPPPYTHFLTLQCTIFDIERTPFENLSFSHKWNPFHIPSLDIFSWFRTLHHFLLTAVNALYFEQIAKPWIFLPFSQP